MRIAVGQLNPRVGDLEENSAQIAAWLDECEQEGVELLVLPELALTGYPPRDLLLYPAFLEACERTLQQLAQRTRKTTVVVGYAESNPGPGAPAFNSAAVLAGGKVVQTFRKQLLPNYDVFEERRYFEAGDGEVAAFEVGGTRIGVTICEDSWNVANGGSWKYTTQPLDAWRGKVDLLLNLSASPFSLGQTERRIEVFRQASQQVGAPILVCNQAGGNDELVFDGASFWVEPEGDWMPLGSAFEQSVVLFSTDSLQMSGGLKPWPDSEPAWIEQALVAGLRDYAGKSGVGSVCLGLSGGIDSSVVAALAVRALGRENVSGISLPTRFTSEASREDARSLAEHLGIEFHECSVDDLFASYQSNWKKWFGTTPASLTLENLQPRIRMTVLMAHANELGHLLLNTSNKSEIATGYATLYGDSAGALSVIGDLLKGQVYDLARYLNQKGAGIGDRILERPPTAELREDQTDDQSLPPYSVLDPLVQSVVVDRKGANELDEAVEGQWWNLFRRLHGGSEFKRHQLPPVLRVSARAFGMGRRMPIAAKSPLSSD